MSHAEVARRKYGQKIFAGTFEDYEAPDSFFDCITLQDVFDHVVDPVGVLQKCHRILKPDGLLVIKVHDMSSLYAKITGRPFYALIPPVHLFYFNRIALATALQKASFDIVFSKHIGHLMFLRTIFYRLSRRDPKNFFYPWYRFFSKTRLGKLKVHKNLHDIITVLAVKSPGE